MPMTLKRCEICGKDLLLAGTDGKHFYWSCGEHVFEQTRNGDGSSTWSRIGGHQESSGPSESGRERAKGPSESGQGGKD